jgi:serine phosphatase RsbU (regulator of sigma subunit)
LPLGLTPDAHWAEAKVELEPGDRIVFLSDGIIEARNGKRELLGFQRAQELTVQPAAAIARAAEQFGQQDDITVVSISRQPAPAYAS